jgi:hypothetical protein
MVAVQHHLKRFVLNVLARKLLNAVIAEMEMCSATRATGQEKRKS